MDRFIAKSKNRQNQLLKHLKSNMDRFIAAIRRCMKFRHCNLKSNMDRFIELIYTTFKKPIKI